MAYREALMADARKWGDAVFASSIRILEAEYRMLKKRDDFFIFFGRWRGEAGRLTCTENI